MSYQDTLFKYNLIASGFCDPGTLVKYSNDTEWVIRYNVAKHSWCPFHILEKLANDNFSEVRYGVRYNSNCSLKLKQSIDALDYILVFG